MKRFALSSLCLALCYAPPAMAQKLTEDAAFPSDYKDRTFLPSAAVAGIRDKMERVVGYWAFVDKNGKIEVTTERPASFQAVTTSLTKVTLTDGEPAYDGVITNASDLTAGLPVLSVSWGSNQRGQVTITDSAQFVSEKSPISSDWAKLPKPTNGGRWIFIDAATVSLVSIDVLQEKNGALDALLGALRIGGKNYQSTNTKRRFQMVSLFVKRDPISIAAGAPAVNMLPSSIEASVGKGLDALSSQ